MTRTEFDQIKATTDWKRVFVALGLERQGAKNKDNDWWALSPFQAEKTASFHIDDTGYFHCFASGRGGDMLDLVQALQNLSNAYEAARWLRDHHCCQPTYGTDAPVRRTKKATNRTLEPVAKANAPIRQSLLPLLTEQGTHVQFAERGISAATCSYLGCGYLDPQTLRCPENSMAGKIVFQVRGLSEDNEPVILSHLGRATTLAQQERDGKWTFYKGFSKSIEVYGIDLLLTNPEALAQIQATGHTILVEGCFDVAKCVEAGIYNVVATFGAKLSEVQVQNHLQRIAAVAGVNRFLVWYDRDPTGEAGQTAALKKILEQGLVGEGFRWDRKFASATRGMVALPPELNDVCTLSVEQLQWLRGQGII